jgi:hypothetical protein
MVSNEIRNNAAALGTLMHQVSNEQAALIRIVRSNLAAAADTAEEMERNFVVPQIATQATAEEAEVAEDNEFKEAM